jgi:hypothetical protein
MIAARNCHVELLCRLRSATKRFSVLSAASKESLLRNLEFLSLESGDKFIRQ